MKNKLLLILFAVIQTTSAFNNKKIAEYLQNKKDFSGAILISHKNSVIFKQYYGFENRELKIANNSKTQFPIASNTKIFTATAIMLLQDKKLLQVTDNISKYIPEAHNFTSVTIHHLLTHTSGIPCYYKKWADICSCKNLDNIIRQISTWQQEFIPGSSYQYSNTNYLLLAHIIEKVSGLPYYDFLMKNMFHPLNMHNTNSVSTDDITKIARGYISNNNNITKSPLITSPLTLIGNGDLCVSLDDLHIWLKALFSSKIITKPSLDILAAKQTALSQHSTRAHGYGCFIDKKDNKTVVEHTGALIGFLSKFMVFPDDDIMIIILTNVENLEIFSEIEKQIPNMLFSDGE
ncbi:MAG: beta-lactamase family protein [Epsilonproteobacteria bacterium]|nr:beta-lactamase family protein [Campylobacterota bacterium]